MRFLLAFGILCGARVPVAVGWAMFICLWKIADMLGDLKSNKPETANNTPQRMARPSAGATYANTICSL
jgi:hypothetical protein